MVVSFRLHKGRKERRNEMAIQKVKKTRRDLYLLNPKKKLNRSRLDTVYILYSLWIINMICFSMEKMKKKNEIKY